MHKTRLSLLLLATLTGCVGNRTPLLNPPPGKPDASRKTSDAGMDKQADGGLPDARPEAPDRAPDLSLDTSRPDSIPDRPGDLPVPDTRPPSRDLLPDRAADLPRDTRWLDTRPITPDLVPDGTGDLVPDRPLDAPGTDSPGRDLPRFEGLSLDRAADREPDGPALDATVGDTAAALPDSGSDASPSDTMAACVPGTPYPLVLGQDQRLYRFDPEAVSLTGIADVSCGDADLNSMTASPLGAAYISNLEGQLCKLDVRTFETTLTTFDANLIGNLAYGMALLSDSSPRGQSLYIAINNSSASAELKVINLASYTFGDIGPIDPAVPRTELTAGPGDTLFALHPSRPSSLLHLDPQTAKALEVVTLPNSASGSFALVYWEDSFYLFMEDGTDPSLNDVYRYRMNDGQTTLVGTLPVQIIGAGVALCQ